MSHRRHQSLLPVSIANGNKYVGCVCSVSLWFECILNRNYEKYIWKLFARANDISERSDTFIGTAFSHIWTQEDGNTREHTHTQTTAAHLNSTQKACHTQIESQRKHKFQSWISLQYHLIVFVCLICFVFVLFFHLFFFLRVSLIPFSHCFRILHLLWVFDSSKIDRLLIWCLLLGQRVKKNTKAAGEEVSSEKAKLLAACFVLFLFMFVYKFVSALSAYFFFLFLSPFR